MMQSSTSSNSTPPFHVRLLKNKKLLTIGAMLIILATIAFIFYITIAKFNAQVTVNHADHSRQSPFVHQIVHVRQKLVVGIDPNYPPMGYKPQDQLIGYDVDLAKAVAHELNVPVEFIEGNFSSSLDTQNLGEPNLLTQDKVDVIISSVPNTRSRQQYYSLTNPYLELGQVAVTKSSAAPISSIDDLKGKKLVTVKHRAANDYLSVLNNDDRIIRVDSPSKAAEAVGLNSAEVWVADAPVAQAALQNNDDLKIASDLLTHEEYSIVVMRGEKDLVQKLNAIIEQLRQKGVLESLRHKWLE